MCRRPRTATAIDRLRGRIHVACFAALLVSLALPWTPAQAGTGYVDGISDQSLPAWDGSFATSPFASLFRSRWGGPGGGQITLARYVVQWDAMTQDSSGGHAEGNYRERFEAWLQDVRTMGLTPVLALTSYDGVHPGSPGSYRTSLEAIIGRAAAIGYPIRYVEPWNEPNNQGRESAVTAAAFANAADGVCEAMRTCAVIAGDLEDRSTVAAYAHQYARALTFHAAIWGVHPYVSVSSHSDVNVRRLIDNLPAHGAGAEVWFTEIGALYCSHGEVRGEARQASDAAYLVKDLLGDPALAPAHTFYYGFLFAGHGHAPCAAGGGDDSELYGSSDEPRAAAGVVLSPPGVFGGAGGAEAGPWPPWSAAANLMIDPLPEATRGR